MTRTEHLSVYDLILTTRAPLYIGSGNVITKTEYLFNPRTEMVTMINTEALFNWLYRMRLADSYESFVLSGDTRLYRFLRDHNITNRDLEDLGLYNVDAADALDDSHSLKEIHTFIRNSDHRAYIPGSSIKGAIRTVILAGLMAENKVGSWPNDPNRSRRATQMQELEGQYLNTLDLKIDRSGKRINDPVNSILRGLSVSDSELISDSDMILVAKIDVNETGEYKKIPLCRECIRPGTSLRFKLTLDHSSLPEEFTSEWLMKQILAFDDYYDQTYLARFTPPDDAVAVSYRNAIIIGGGSGFFAKTLTYPYLGVQDGMQYTEKIMCEQFIRHKHEHDISKHGVSPHTMKYGKYRGELYPYGVCGVQIL